eukprot:TRINITY_DN1471_c1_g1_i1.p1 TRINITY_DN1471_c1_g1~~TRINITY_DN1471_c1_g1_i1.p1  ORF type:complete len:807 (+),score=159.68 TRINITY_DN1471_c1_g1_i1:55-2475(+)
MESDRRAPLWALPTRLMGYVRDHMREGGGSEREVQHKAVCVLFLAACFVATIPTVMVYPSTAAVPVFVLGILAWAWWRREVGEAYLRFVTVGFSLSLCYYDLLGASVGTRQWLLFVILLDVLLVIEAPRYLTKAVVVFVVAWLLLVEVEFSTRAMGLFDLPDSYSYDRRRAICDCEKPPCAQHHGLGAYLGNLAGLYAVFLVDFFLTRGYADKVLAEKKKMAAAVAAAEDIAGSLAGFDLDAAGRRLERSAADLPPELYGHMEGLLENLGSYRPYLPDELFRRKTQGGDEVPASVPGSGDGGFVALAFTDIRSSTALWESNAPAMATALAMHNEAIRAAAALFDGYEAKTIGDAFMISFHTSSDAVRFGGAAQTALGAELRWPEGLARPDMDDGLPVLGVRMGIHCGEAVAQRNALTSRYDYFGPTVNRAARVEPFGASGAVTVTADVMDDVGAGVLDTFMIFPYVGLRTGKGLADPLALTALVPRATGDIAGRVRQVAMGVEQVALAALRERRQSIQSTSTDDAADAASVSSSFSVASIVTHRLSSKVFRRSDGASVGVVNFAPFRSLDEAWDPQRAEVQLQALYDAVQATKGQVSSVVGTLAWASWGLHAPCTDYFKASARCMVLLRHALSARRGAATEGVGPSFHAGLASGAVAGVELALRRGRRFVTLFGATAWMAGALCQRAEEVGRCVLVGCAGAAGPAALEGHVTRIGGSDEAHGALAGVDVWVLELGSFPDEDLALSGPDDQPSFFTNLVVGSVCSSNLSLPFQGSYRGVCLDVSTPRFRPLLGPLGHEDRASVDGRG